MAIPKWLADFIKFVVINFGREILVWTADRIRSVYRCYFADRNILILGARQTGKSSLICYLHNGKPYEEVHGEVHAPNPTSGAAIVDRKFTVHKGEWLRVQKDVGGDPAFRPLWEQMIQETAPEGIVYMIDGRLGNANLKRAVEELRSDVLRHFESDRGRLVALHVFLNFGDNWAASQREVRRRSRLVLDEIEKAIQGNEALESIRFEVSETQLSPERTSWPEVDRAIHKFGAALIG